MTKLTGGALGWVVCTKEKGKLTPSRCTRGFGMDVFNVYTQQSACRWMRVPQRTADSLYLVTCLLSCSSASILFASAVSLALSIARLLFSACRLDTCRCKSSISRLLLHSCCSTCLRANSTRTRLICNDEMDSICLSLSFIMIVKIHVSFDEKWLRQRLKNRQRCGYKTGTSYSWGVQTYPVGFRCLPDISSSLSDGFR